MTIGDVRVWLLEDARKEANRLQALVDQGLDPFPLLASDSVAQATVDLMLAHPFMQGLWHAADLRRDGLYGRLQGRVLAKVFLHQAHRAFADFGVVFLLFVAPSSQGKVPSPVRCGYRIRRHLSIPAKIPAALRVFNTIGWHRIRQQKTREASSQAGLWGGLELVAFTIWCPGPESNRHAIAGGRF